MANKGGREVVRRRYSAALGAALLFASCEQSEAPANQARLPPADLVLSDAHDGGVYPIRPGMTLEVRLRDNAAVDPPVEWSLAGAPLCLGPARRIGVSGDAEADGAAPIWIFRFRAIGEGEGRLMFDGGPSRRRIGMEVSCDSSTVYD